MAFHFDDESLSVEVDGGAELDPSFGLVDEAPAAVADAGVSDIISEAERRFAKARYYEILITEPIFDSADTTPVAVEVVKEVQAFARERLSVLLGVRAERVEAEAQFSEEEVDILKKMAARLLKKPELGGLPATAVAKPVRPAAPALKKARAPKPQAQPAPKAVEAPRPPPARPQAQPAAGAPKKPPLQDTGKVLPVPQKDGSVINYKKVTEGDQVLYIGPNGQRYTLATNAAGQFYMKSAQGQARPRGVAPLAPLSSAAITAISERHARKARAMGAINATGQAANGAATSEAGTGVPLATLLA